MPIFQHLVSFSLKRVFTELIFYRSLLQDKQEELDATQSQAHWLVLQQEAMMSETADELNDISELVNDLLRKFTEEARLGEVKRCYCLSKGRNLLNY